MRQNNSPHLAPWRVKRKVKRNEGYISFYSKMLHQVIWLFCISHSISDLDSVASEALDVYENTANNNDHSNAHSSIARRYSSGDDLHIPSLADNTPFVSEQHPFSYFTDHNNLTQNYHQDDAITEDESPNVNNNDGINVQSVFNMGRKWLGV